MGSVALSTAIAVAPLPTAGPDVSLPTAIAIRLQVTLVSAAPPSVLAATGSVALSTAIAVAPLPTAGPDVSLPMGTAINLLPLQFPPTPLPLPSVDKSSRSPLPFRCTALRCTAWYAFLIFVSVSKSSQPENCPSDIGTCVSNECVFKNGYNGLKTYPHAFATNYCQLSSGTCNGVTQVQPPLTTASNIASALSLPLCDGSTPSHGNTCVGIAAAPPRMIGNSQNDMMNGQYVTPWGQGLTEASGYCYKLTGPTGNQVVVALTDRCGGYTTSCSASATCVNDPTLTPACPCVGTVGSLYSTCCGLSSYGCPSLNNQCDWCASSNHPHFDMDTAAFNYLCDSSASAGSCEITTVSPFQCMTPIPQPWN